MAALNRLALNTERLLVCRELFKSLNVDEKGRVSAKDFAVVADRLGYRLSNDQAQAIMKKNNIGGTGSLSFDDIEQALLSNKELGEDEHSMADIRRKFSEYDSDDSGSVSTEEAHQILEKELAFSTRQSEELVSRFDINGDGQLSFEEFVRFYSKVKNKVEEVRHLFAEFDRDGSGSVSTEEARVMLKRYGLNENQTDELIAKYDVDHDGELQYTEFAAFLMDC